jgi:1,4-alpha-glucan branching enzyme
MTSVRNTGEIEFRFYRSGAKVVAVAGDFTNWLDAPVAMRHEGNGWWTARVHLEPGEYRFRYVADGQWFTDFASHGVELKKQVWNSVLLVQETGAPQGREMQSHGLRALAA